MQMTTNLNAVAGPSRMSDPQSEPQTPLTALPDPFGAGAPAAGVSKPGLSVDENGEVVKVPAFLNKLYSMVSDAETDELIYWAPSGDSFYVPDHERFGKELLPRFFKHSNFSSFVRQLNMYGFHKVPHLQSGVLKNEAPSELWEFVSPFFKRGHPDLLARVTRKNHRPAAAGGTSAAAPPPAGPGGTRTSARQAAMPTMHLLTDGTTEGEAATSLVGPQGQLIDLVAIQSGINAIRQTQAAIGADLKALQTSNEHLWREALESRERQQKHEETIDLIVSFLERLFGTEGEGLKGLKEAMRRGGLGRQREEAAPDETGKKRRRVGSDRMLGDGREPEPEQSRFHEINSEPTSARIEPYVPSNPAKMSRSSSGRSMSEFTGARVTPLSTEDEAAVSPFTSASTSAAARNPHQTLYPSAISPMSDAPSVPDPAAASAAFAGGAGAGAGAGPGAGHSALAPYSPYGLAGPLGSAPVLGPDAYAAAGAGTAGVHLDPALMQTTIGSLLQSPAAAQMFLNSLNASAQGQALATPTKAAGPGTGAGYGGGGGGGGPPSSYPVSPDASASGSAGSADPTLALFSPLAPAPSLAALDRSTADLLGAYRKADGVGRGVDDVQDSIDSLVRSMGLDLPQGAGAGVGAGVGADGLAQPLDAGAGYGLGAGGPAFDEGFNVDEFLESLANANANEQP